MRHQKPDCPLCHGVGGNHRPLNTPIRCEPLSAKEWEKVYFVTQQWIGTLHAIVAEARWREEAEDETRFRISQPSIGEISYDSM